MKLNFTRVVTYLPAIAVLLLYASCKKNDLQTSAAKTPFQDSVAGHVLASFRQSLSASYGGVNLNDGIKNPVNFAASPRVRVMLGLGPMCGFTIDSTYNYYQDKHDDSAHHYWGHFTFSYECSTDHLDGYRVSDSVNYKWSGELFFKSYSVYQNFTVKALDNTYKLVAMNGTTGGTTDIFSGTRVGDEDVFTSHYNYNNVFVDLSSGTAVMTGTVTFAGAYQDRAPILSDTFIGKITFTGDKTYAHMMIHYEYPPLRGAENTTDYYTINLTTGEIAPEN